MSRYKDAALTLKRMAVKYEALMAAAAALDEIGSLEQAAAENQKAAAEAVEAANRARAELANLVEEIEQAKIKRADKLKETDDIVAKAIFNANEQAAAILAQADKDATQLRSDASAQGKADLNSLTRQVQDLQSTKAKLVTEITTMQERARVAADEAEAAEKRLAKVKESIAKLAAG